jgi:hypothetical protein
MRDMLYCDDTWTARRSCDAEPDCEARALRIIKNKAPDTSGVNKAAVDSAATGAAALAWAKQIFEEQAPARAETAALDKRVAESQIAGMDFATAQARDDAQRRKTIFNPIEDSLAADAQAYDTPQRRAEEAARASADVESAAGMAVADMRRSTLRHGGSLEDGDSRGGALDLALGKARMRAGASDAAVRNVEQQGYARKMDVAGLGKGVVSSQATQQQIASQTGAGATGAAGAALNATMSGNGTMQAGYGQAMQGYGQAGNLYGQAAQIKNTARGQDLSFLSNVFGSFMSSSDKNKKKKTGKAANEEQALAQINATPVEEGWQYDPAKGGPDDGGMPHTGPMAQEVRATMGNKVAPGGKVIDMVSMNGKLMAGMKALTKRIERIEKAVA